MVRPLKPYAPASFSASGKRLQFHRAEAVVVEQLLPLAHHAEVAVVHHDDLDGQAVRRRWWPAPGSTSGSRRRRRWRTPACRDARTARRWPTGRPKPIAPSPPELIQSRGSLKRINCAAHIWCWPTSDADDGLAGREPVDFHHQVLRLDFVIGGDGREGMLVLPGADLRPPGRRAAAGCFACDLGLEFRRAPCSVFRARA